MKFHKIVLSSICFLIFINHCYSQEINEKTVQLKVNIQELKDFNDNVKLIFNRTDTIDLINKSKTCYEGELKRNFDFEQPKSARLMVNADGVGQDDKIIQSPYFLIDSSNIVVNWDLGQVISVEGGPENHMLQLFHKVEQEAASEIKNYSIGLDRDIIDSINQVKNIKLLKIIEESVDSHTAYTKLLTLFRPSSFDLRAEIEKTVSSFSKSSFSDEELRLLKNRYEEYVQRVEIQNDPSNFPVFSTLPFQETISFESLKSKHDYLLIDVWATWCGPCLAQHPTIDSLYSANKDTKDFTIVGLAISSSKDHWLNYLKKEVVKYPNYYLDSDNSEIFKKALNIMEIPRYVLLRTKDLKLVEQQIEFNNIERVLRKYKLIE
ncbi:TlpA family protein disulfide reductase [Sphingobacterium sp. BS-2]|uniref:TlpA family protein disulfide reductase n=1 Tax=Sphingobacterium sp. BS-2 TaxID=3377129 RepID=UPI0038FC71EE